MRRLVGTAVLALPLSVVFACGGSTPPPSQPPETAGLDAATATPTPTPTPTPTATATATPTPDLDASTPPAPAAPAAPTDTSDAASSFDMPVVFGVYKQHKDALTAACWLHSKSTEKAYIGKATIRLGPTGKVISTKTEGTDDAASTCVDAQIKKWKFPPPSGTATIVLPVHLHRD